MSEYKDIFINALIEAGCDLGTSILSGIKKSREPAKKKAPKKPKSKENG